ncbi:beta-ketoacyl synthase N-terminal-like domain-containing protein [Salinispora arenicola]|uniref:beta-ketoacyl synthase N-terminal-like domain-containing protein n=1 Tax=Salinispora arenicola TaxID=168697 RepID=UPI0003784F5C|nr:beta-ketoacyl synthase N-terminal-like domain-containing protein [Salinispora arenicola]
MSQTTFLVTGWSLHLPGVAVGATLAKQIDQPRGDWAWQAAPEPEQASQVLGRKGLLAKEPATRLALCAVHQALGLAPGRRPDRELSVDTAVVVASNLGNVAAVARVAQTVAKEGGGRVSVLDAPNVSSNVIASSVALWFGFGGPNLLVCSGRSAGMDALVTAGLLLRAGRARRVVLVGAEPDDEIAAGLFDHGTSPVPLRRGAACLVLERHRSADAEAAVVLDLVREQRWPHPPRLVVGRRGVVLARQWGEFDGAHDIVAVATAVHLVADEGHQTVGVVGDRDRGALVSVASVRRS